MIGFFPRGLKGKGVVDPTQTANEFIEAMKVARRVGPHQMLDAGFIGSRAKLAVDEHVWRKEAEVTAPSGSDPNHAEQIGAGVGHANLWYIPYNQSFAEVGDGDVALSWVSTYPETVLVLFSFQYLRLDMTRFPGYSGGDDSTHRHIRAQLLLDVDGARVDGTGPFGLFQNSWRGTGYGCRSARTTLWTVAHLEAGPHRISPVAAQAPCVAVNAESQSDTAQVIDDDIANGVAIGHRRLVLVGFPRGKQVAA